MTPRSKEYLRSLGVVNPDLLAEIKRQGREGADFKPNQDINERREVRARLLDSLRPDTPIPGPIPESVQESMTSVTGRDGNVIPIKVYQPVAGRPGPKEGERPVYVAFHEGGLVMGDLTDEDLNCRMLTRDLGVVCFNVDYRLAPEHPFPAAHNDCWDSLKWVAKNASIYGADARHGFVIGGASAGGNLTASMACVARDEKLDPPLTGQFQSCTLVLPTSLVPERYKDEYLSMTENKDDPVLSPPVGLDLWAALSPLWQLDMSVPNALTMPAVHPDGHKDLPRAYFQVCGLDVLRDDGLIYERMLREEVGIETKLDVYPGFGHMFWTNFPRLKMSEQVVRDTLEGIRWLFEGK